LFHSRSVISMEPDAVGWIGSDELMTIPHAREFASARKRKTPG
jgi:hypothetical protein